MIELAVTNAAETFERVRGPLADRGVEARRIAVDSRTVDLDDPPWTPERFDVGFVYPGRLMEGGVADVCLDVPWVNDRDAVLASRNKAGALARLERVGLPIPRSTLVSNPVDEDELVATFERFEPPVVVKPNSTTRGVGVARAADVDSFLGICDYLSLVHDYRATGDRSFLVQEYVPNAVDYRAMVLEGEYVGAVERRPPPESRTRDRWKQNVHRGGEAVGVALPDRLRDLAVAAATAVGVPFCGVDLLVGASGDRPLVTETNARPTVDEATKYEPDFYDRLAATVRDRAEE